MRININNNRIKDIEDTKIELKNDLIENNDNNNLNDDNDNIDDEKLTWRYDSTSGSEKIYAIYDDKKNTAFNKDKDIVVQIDLANIGTDAQKWTAKGGTTTAAYTGVSDIASTITSKPNITVLKINKPKNIDW